MVCDGHGPLMCENGIWPQGVNWNVLCLATNNAILISVHLMLKNEGSMKEGMAVVVRGYLQQ